MDYDRHNRPDEGLVDPVTGWEHRFGGAWHHPAGDHVAWWGDNEGGLHVYGCRVGGTSPGTCPDAPQTLQAAVRYAHKEHDVPLAGPWATDPQGWAQREAHAALTDGDLCPDCAAGRLDVSTPPDCTCHVSPPCEACITTGLACDACGWRVGDEVFGPEPAPDPAPDPTPTPERDRVAEALALLREELAVREREEVAARAAEDAAVAASRDASDRRRQIAHIIDALEVPRD